jgi:hypothetical protein
MCQLDAVLPETATVRDEQGVAVVPLVVHKLEFCSMSRLLQPSIVLVPLH